MPGQVVGSMIGASFGLVYVFVNSGSLPGSVRWAVRLLAAAVFIAVVLASVRLSRRGPAEPGTDVAPRSDPGSGSPFGRSYWLVVALEVVAIVVGARLLSGPLDLPEAGVAWVSVVVGVHFFALAVIFRQSFFHWLGAAIAGCGALGIVLALLDAGSQPVEVVAGVVPGALLLAFGWWGVRRESPVAPPRTQLAGR